MGNTAGKIQCSGCHRYFASNTAFEMHRKGDYTTGRQCMTEAEMRGKGMDTERKEVRIYVEGLPKFEVHPVWYDAVGREKVRAAFQTDLSEE